MLELNSNALFTMLASPHSRPMELFPTHITVSYHMVWYTSFCFGPYLWMVDFAGGNDNLLVPLWH